jgi:hypothetical protein
LFHNLDRESIKGNNAGLHFAAPKELATMNIGAAR